MAQALDRHCRMESGAFAGIEDVDNVGYSTEQGKKDLYQKPHFISATLKYLYLTFSDETVLSLDEWIFTGSGHPLPILRSNRNQKD